MPYEKTIALLKQIVAATTDLNLKTQINQRITVDNLQIEKFKETNPKCVFVVQYPDNSIHGIYGEYATALQNSTDLEDDFTIKKYHIISSKFEPVVLHSSLEIRNMDSEHQTEFDSVEDIPDCLGEIEFDKNGELSTFYTCELDNEQTREVENLDSERFENAFVPYPVFF